MIEQDTIKLLRECDAGIKMGVKSIDDVEKYVKSGDMRNLLNKCKDEHKKLENEVEVLLNAYGDDGKAPNLIATGMSWMKTNVKLSMHHSDKTVADLMTDGCNMGVKSLSGYLNQYKAASERSKDIAKKLIAIESDLGENMRPYL
ncbi:MAG: hypothetical protein IKC61_05720 [Clostridia bacterium]|nr:hypothetical protein [Clostridia bacterium]